MDVGGIESVVTSIGIVDEQPAHWIDAERPRAIGGTRRCRHNNRRPHSEAVHSIPPLQVSEVLSAVIDKCENARDFSREHGAKLAAPICIGENSTVQSIHARKRLRLLQSLAPPFNLPHEIDANSREKTPTVKTNENSRDLLA